MLFRPQDAVMCAFHDNGSVVEINPFKGKITMYDKNNEPVWVSQENAHHMVNFTADMQKMLLMTSEIISINGASVRSDCFSIRDLNNNKLHEWCLGKHLSELESMGYNYHGLWTVALNSYYKNETAKKEVSHANSFYEIGPNALEKKHPAFSRGNFILHLYGPTKALLVLDSQLQKILWHKKMDVLNLDGINHRIHTHDNQITPEGNLISYFSSVESVLESQKLQHHSRLVELNPLTDEVVWQYKRKPLESFFSPILASVSKVNKDNYLFNDGFSAYEVTSSGEVVWQFKNPERSAGYPVNIVVLKPFYNTAFLHSRGILD